MNRIQKSTLLILLSLPLFTLVRLALLIIYYPQFQGLSLWDMLAAFIHGLLFDASIVILLSAPLLLLLNFPLRWLDAKLWFNSLAWLWFGVVVAMVFFLFADLIYFGEVSRHVANEVTAMGNDYMLVIQLIPIYAVHTLLFLIVAIVLGLVWRRVLRLPVKAMRLSVVQYLAFVFVLTAVARGGFGLKPIGIVNAYDRGSAEYGNLVLNGVFNAVHASRKNSRGDEHRFYKKEEARKTALEHRQVLDAEYPFVQQIPDRGNGSKKFNIVFLLLEGVSYKYIDALAGNGFGVTPNLDNIANNGISFSQFYSTGQRSIEGIQAVFSGIPVILGVPWIGMGLEATNFSRIGTIADRHNYQTLFVQAGLRNSYRLDAVSRALGFTQYYGMEDTKRILDYPDKEPPLFGWDYETMMLFKEKIDNLRQPFLAFVYTGSTHAPYPRLPERFIKHPDSRKDESGFLNTLYYSDWAIGELLKAAKQGGWFDNTVFIITADHPVGKYKSSYFPDLFHVPLIIYAPKIFPAQRIDRVASHLDLLPTLMELLGFPDRFAAFGQSVFSPGDGYAMVTRGKQAIALINDQAYLSHSLKKRVDNGTLDGKPLNTDYANQMERKLLSLDQISYELIQANKWLPIE